MHDMMAWRHGSADDDGPGQRPEKRRHAINGTQLGSRRGYHLGFDSCSSHCPEDLRSSAAGEDKATALFMFAITARTRPDHVS